MLNLNNLPKNHSQLNNNKQLWKDIAIAFTTPEYQNNLNDDQDYFISCIKRSFISKDITFAMERLLTALLSLTLNENFYKLLPNNLVIDSDKKRFDLCVYLTLNLDLIFETKKRHVSPYVSFLRCFNFTE